MGLGPTHWWTPGVQKIEGTNVCCAYASQSTCILLWIGAVLYCSVASFSCHFRKLILIFPRKFLNLVGGRSCSLCRTRCLVCSYSCLDVGGLSRHYGESGVAWESRSQCTVTNWFSHDTAIGLVLLYSLLGLHCRLQSSACRAWLVMFRACTQKVKDITHISVRITIIPRCLDRLTLPIQVLLTRYSHASASSYSRDNTAC